jgi:hypothetical protein
VQQKKNGLKIEFATKMSLSCSKEGYLRKRGAIRTAYQLRRVMLTQEGELRYFDEHNNERGRIPAKAIEAVRFAPMPIDDDTGAPTIFHVVCPNRTFEFNAPSHVAAIEWVDAIQEHINARADAANAAANAVKTDDNNGHVSNDKAPEEVANSGLLRWLGGLVSRSSASSSIPTPAAAPSADDNSNNKLAVPAASSNVKRMRGSSGIGDVLLSLPTRLTPQALGRWLTVFNRRNERNSINRMPLDAMSLDIPIDKIGAFAAVLQDDKLSGPRNECAVFVATFQPTLEGSEFRAFVSKLVTELRTNHESLLKQRHLADPDELYDVAETFLAQLVYRPSMLLFGAKDAAFHERLQRLWFVTPSMLDIPERYVEPHALVAAARELRAVDRLHAPRAILAAFLRTCRRIYVAMNAADAERIQKASAAAGYEAGGAAADDFVPVLSFVIMKSNVERLTSALNIVSAWRPPELLNGEAGYYFVSCAMVAAFIESADATAFTGITREQFQSHMTDALPPEARSWRARWGAIAPQLEESEADEWVLLEE